MHKDNNKRKTKRIDFVCEAKIRFPEEEKEISVNIKDITVTGARIIIGSRIVKVNTDLEMKLHIKDRHIKCKGRIAWVLALRPSLGNISVFDVGIEFVDMKPEDRSFLEKLLG